MKKDTLIDAVNSLEGDLIDEYFKYSERLERRKKGRVRREIIRCVAVAACLCIVVGTALLIQSRNTASGDVDTSAGIKLVTYYDGDVSGINTSYPEPKPGEVRCTVEVARAMEAHVEEDTVFLLTVDLRKSDGDKMTFLNEEETEAEYGRLESLGYVLCTLDTWGYGYGGEIVCGETAALCITEEQFKAFECSGDYGYFFRFIKNGDGSPVSVDESEIIKAFPCSVK